MKNFLGVDLAEIPQVADISNPFGTLISDSYLWFVSPSTDKLLKVVLEGSMLSYTDDPYRNADLTQESVFIKSWGVGVATNSIAGVIDLS